jgi:uncharacterized protein (TIGR03067 family)
MLLIAAGLVLFTGAALAADDDDVKAEWKKLNGNWTPSEGEAAGAPLPEENLKKMKLMMKDGRYEVKIGDEMDKGNLKLNPKKKPKEVDVESVEGTNQGRTFKAIYEIDGDTLKVCYQVGDGERPKEFKTAAGETIALITFKRDK